MYIAVSSNDGIEYIDSLIIYSIQSMFFTRYICLFGLASLPLSGLLAYIHFFKAFDWNT